ncbi:MAG: hypothetical protein WCK54_18405 [Desulfuromonadales bacterium]
MEKITKPAGRVNCQTGFVAGTGGVMNCPDNTRKLPTIQLIGAFDACSCSAVILLAHEVTR